MQRPDWDEYFMKMAKLAAERSTCLRRQVGAILVKERQILATGYNGAPSGVDHCDKSGCLRQELEVPSGERHEICRGVHAEQNLVAQAAFHGVKTEDSTVYCTNQPCVICVKLLINAGVERIYFQEGYDDPFTEKLLTNSGVVMKKFKAGEEK